MQNNKTQLRFHTHIGIFIDKLKSLDMTAYYSTICEDFALPDNEWFARAASLSLKRDIHNPDKGYICLNLLHPHYMLNASTFVKYGDKETLLSFFKESDCTEQLVSAAKTIDGKLRECDDD